MTKEAVMKRTFINYACAATLAFACAWAAIADESVDYQGIAQITKNEYRAMALAVDELQKKFGEDIPYNMTVFRLQKSSPGVIIFLFQHPNRKKYVLGPGNLDTYSFEVEVEKTTMDVLSAHWSR